MPSCSHVDSIPVSTILTISSPTIPLKKESQGFHGRVPFLGKIRIWNEGGKKKEGRMFGDQFSFRPNEESRRRD